MNHSYLKASHLFFTLLICMLIPVSHAQSIAEQGRAFLAENSKREDIQVTESGLQYMIVKPGNEKRANKKDKVLAHYQGKHINGEVFDSSFGGEPVKFKLSRTIDGWEEGIQLIGEGGRIVLYVPPELGYGKRGSKPLIQSNETLVFIVDLVEIISKK